MTRCPDPWLDERGIAADTSRAGREYLYLPGELLMGPIPDGRLRGEVLAELDRAGATREPGIAYDTDDPARGRWRPTSEEVDVSARLGVERWFVRPEQDVPRLARRLRATTSTDVPISPNHVWTWQPFWIGGPGSRPRPAAGPAPATPAPAGSTKGEGGVGVAVLDTGIVGDWSTHGWFDTRVVADPTDAEELDVDADAELDEQAGHGTFIAAIVAREAPDARIRARRVMTSHGLVDEARAAQAIFELAHDGQRWDVLSLSFGGYTMGDRAPLATREALAQLRPEVAVVAAAGNAGSDRPFWPAALKTVIAVGAHDGGDPPAPACFTNHGWWVDCCAPGVDVHSMFVTFDAWPAGPGKEDFEGHAVWSGTSFAAPLVAGRIAAEAARSGNAPRDVAHQLLRAPGLRQLADLGTLIV